MKCNSKLMLCLGIAAMMAISSPTYARKKSITDMIGEAVSDRVHNNESVTLPAKGSVEVAFSPNGGCTAATVRFIAEAHHTIRVAAYGLTSNPIGKALIDAKKRGVDVQVVADRDHNGRRNSPNSIANMLAANGIPVRIDSAVKIQHNKVIIVDSQSVQNGSFNLTAAAQTSNAENIIIHRGFPELARVFTDNWDHLWQESVVLRPTY